MFCLPPLLHSLILLLFVFLCVPTHVCCVRVACFYLIFSLTCSVKFYAPFLFASKKFYLPICCCCFIWQLPEHLTCHAKWRTHMGRGIFNLTARRWSSAHYAYALCANPPFPDSMSGSCWGNSSCVKQQREWKKATATINIDKKRKDERELWHTLQRAVLIL